MQQIIITRKDGDRDVTSCVDKIEDGAWIRLFNTTETELKDISDACAIPLDFLKAALDEEERAAYRYRGQRGARVIDIPTMMENEGIKTLTTLPLGIIVTEKNIVTVCKYESHLLEDFLSGKVRHFATFKKTRFLFQIFYRNASLYLHNLRQIEKSISHIESELHKSLKNEELFNMMEMQKSLIYFSTLAQEQRGGARTDHAGQAPADVRGGLGSLDDVITENKQALEMSQIYLHILNGMTDTFATIISNNLNIVMNF